MSLHDDLDLGSPSQRHPSSSGPIVDDMGRSSHAMNEARTAFAKKTIRAAIDEAMSEESWDRAWRRWCERDKAKGRNSFLWWSKRPTMYPAEGGLAVLAVIPARGGSSVKDKNIREVGGQPLIQWSIEQALDSKLLTHVTVSTDSKKIAETVTDRGFLGYERCSITQRPAGLATADSKVVHTLIHAVNCQRVRPDWVVILEPTSFMRPPGLIDKCIRAAMEGDFDSLVSSTTIDSPLEHLYVIEDGQHVPMHPALTIDHTDNRQGRRQITIPNGQVWIVKTDFLLKTISFLGGKVGTVPVEKKWLTFGIDEERDIEVAEVLANHFSEIVTR